MDKEHAQRLGAVIREHRQAAGLSLRDLDELTGVDNSLIARMEQGAILTPAPDKLSRIAEALHIPLADLYAIAGYDAPNELPALRPYLRTKYRRLPSSAADELEAYIDHLEQKHGVDLSGPKPGEDETPAPSRTAKKKGGTSHGNTRTTKR
jgi:transcriptional regulator with XRE-family HTH domain